MQLDIFAAQDSSSGKTCQAHSAQTKVETLLAWLVKWQDSASLYPKTAGEPKAWRWVRTDLSNGACLTRSGSEWRSGGVACSLSSTLETGPIDSRFFLSRTASEGILRRAERRGKTLPEALEMALRAAAGLRKSPQP